MGGLLAYSIFSSILLCCGYILYKWLFSDENQHGYNRFLIYSIYILALGVPFGIKYMEPIFFHSSGSPSVEIGEIKNVLAPADVRQTPVGISIATILLYVYLTGMALVTVYSIMIAVSLRRIISNGVRMEWGESQLYVIDREDIAPFSWMGYIMMSRKDMETAGDVIFIHEKRHVELFHWIDLVLAQLVLVIQWFNPAAWLFREEFKTVHEYQADEAVLSAGKNIKEYQMLLLKKAVGTRFQALANSLNHSKLKKRITMMYKEKTTHGRRWSALMLVPALTLGCAIVQLPSFAKFLNMEASAKLVPDSFGKSNEKTPNMEIKSVKENVVSPVKTIPPVIGESPAFSEQSESMKPINDKDNRKQDDYDSISEIKKPIHSDEADMGNKIYSAVDEVAQPQGDMKGLMEFLRDNIVYPEEAVKEGLQGRVIVRFIVGKDGKVTDPTILKSVAPSLDNEALRVVKEMPDWTPGKVKGEAVDSYYVIPISFKLPDDKEQP